MGRPAVTGFSHLTDARQDVVRCVLDDGHEDYHTDGSGNRWTT